MGYLHINNLYKEQTILLFKECYAMEKVHGTSAHISWNEDKLGFFSCGEKHDRFVALFDQEKLRNEFEQRFAGFKVIVYGEAYGGKQQGMSETYGKELRFIVFDIQINDLWLNVPKMDKVATDLGLEVIPWVKVTTDTAVLDAHLGQRSVKVEHPNQSRPGPAPVGHRQNRTAMSGKPGQHMVAILPYCFGYDQWSFRVQAAENFHARLL